MKPYVTSCLRGMRGVIWNPCLLCLTFPWYMYHAENCQHPQSIWRKMVEEEANIHWRCTLCKRTGLDISFSLSYVNLHNKPLILCHYHHFIMKKLRFGQGMKYTQSHPNSKWQSWYSMPEPKPFLSSALELLIKWQLAEKGSLITVLHISLQRF